MTKTVQFDPGFAPLVYAFAESIFELKTALTIVKSPQQRKFRFTMVKKQIIEVVKNNIAFYLGCLMWAKHLKEDMPELTIENNPFLGVDIEKQNLSEKDLCAETISLIDYFEQYKKDCKFFANETTELPGEWLKIAQIYKEFLTLNKFFVYVKTGADIVLPENIEEIIKTDNKTNLALIDKTIKSQQLSSLMD